MISRLPDVHNMVIILELVVQRRVNHTDIERISLIHGNSAFDHRFGAVVCKSLQDFLNLNIQGSSEDSSSRGSIQQPT